LLARHAECLARRRTKTADAIKAHPIAAVVIALGLGYVVLRAARR
jgi:hypothetical protein